MPSPAELVAALSRAYALTDVFPAGDPVSTEALEHLRRLLRDGATVTVGGAGLRVDGIDVPDFHGRSGRFARDLRMLGVRELEFGAHQDIGDLERFVRMLRDDAVQGEVNGLRASRASLRGEIVLVFEGDGAPAAASPPPLQSPATPAPRERDGEVKPGAALVESIMELFEGDPFDPLSPGGRPAPLQSASPSPSDPAAAVPAAEVAPAPAVEATPAADLGAAPAPDLKVDPAPDLEVDPAPDLEVGPSIGKPSPLILEPEVPSSPALEGGFGFWPEDVVEGPQRVPGEAAPGFAEPDRGLVDSIRSLFDADPKGTWGKLPEPDVEDPLGLGERLPGESPPGGTGSSIPEDWPAHAASPGALEGRGMVGDVSFGRRVQPELVDSPDSVREASFGSPDTLGAANVGGAGRSDSSGPAAGFRWSGGKGPGGGAHLGSGNPPPAPEAEGEGAAASGDGDLGLFDFPLQGELSHPLSFLDEVPGSGLLDQDLALDVEPAPGELPPSEDETETEVPPPAEAWDQLLEPPPSTAWRTDPPGSSPPAADGVSDGGQVQGEVGQEDRSEEGMGPRAGAGEVPPWELDPETPVWHREEGEGSPAATPVMGPDRVGNLFHRVITGSGDQRRQAAEELRSYGGPTLNPQLLDELSNGILGLLRDVPGSTERAGLSLDLARGLATPGVTSRLVARMGQEQDREVRRELVTLFFCLGDPMARALVDALVEETDRACRRNYVEALVGMGAEGVAAVNRMLNDSSWFVVRNGLTILGEMGDEGSAGRVAPVLVHSDLRVRREAVATLARLGGEQADRLVEQRLSDPAPEVRSAAAAGVGARRIGRAQEALQRMLAAETESSVLEAVMGALGALGDSTSVPALEKKASGSFLSRPPREIRIAAYRALQAIGTPHARSIVEAGRKDRDPEIRAALEGIGGSPPPS